jgi:hypothetical protein
MAQTNVQVPIQNRNHDKEVLEKRKILKGDERYKSPGPSAMAMDDRPAARLNYHTSLGRDVGVANDAPDMLYGEHITNKGDSVAGMPCLGEFKHHMSGRVDGGRNQGRNVGSEHIMMPAEPHFPLHRTDQVTQPIEGPILPKDQ